MQTDVLLFLGLGMLAVPIVLATFPLVAGLPRSELYFNLVFFRAPFGRLSAGLRNG